jgi:hypothetical protein
MPGRWRTIPTPTHTFGSQWILPIAGSEPDSDAPLYHASLPLLSPQLDVGLHMRVTLPVAVEADLAAACPLCITEQVA